MKKYKCITIKDIEKYEDWEFIQIIPMDSKDIYVKGIIMKEDKPIQNYIKLHEATTEQLLEELNKRTEGK